MTMEELFRERKVFKDKVIQSVQSELDQFGWYTFSIHMWNSH
jgi:flotillin